MSEKIKLVDTSRYVRDAHSKGLVSVDHKGLKAYRAQRAESERLKEVEMSINSLKADFTEIKQLLQSLVSQHQG